MITLNNKLIVRKRLLSLSAQKFVSDLSRDAYHFAKLRVNGTTARGRPVPAVSSRPHQGADQADRVGPGQGSLDDGRSQSGIRRTWRERQETRLLQVKIYIHVGIS